VIIENGYKVSVLVTAPDKPAGRGMTVKPSPVKEYAISHNLRVMQPISLKDPAFLNDLRGLDCCLVRCCGIQNAAFRGLEKCTAGHI
jgi:methionyl-tRNA formyltransferase